MKPTKFKYRPLQTLVLRFLTYWNNAEIPDQLDVRLLGPNLIRPVKTHS